MTTRFDKETNTTHSVLNVLDNKILDDISNDLQILIDYYNLDKEAITNIKCAQVIFYQEIIRAIREKKENLGI